MVVFDRALPYGTKKSPTKQIQVELDGTLKLKNWNPKIEAFKDGLPFYPFLTYIFQLPAVSFLRGDVRLK